jgi:hypothetical protein
MATSEAVGLKDFPENLCLSFWRSYQGLASAMPTVGERRISLLPSNYSAASDLSMLSMKRASAFNSHVKINSTLLQDSQRANIALSFPENHCIN